MLIFFTGLYKTKSTKVFVHRTMWNDMKRKYKKDVWDSRMHLDEDLCYLFCKLQRPRRREKENRRLEGKGEIGMAGERVP